jgi:Cu+-exporting ATPase
MFRLSRVTTRKIRQNLLWALLYNSLGVPISALGWLNPLIAGAAMALNSLSVSVNPALRRGNREAEAKLGGF